MKIIFTFLSQGILLTGGWAVTHYQGCALAEHGGPWCPTFGQPCSILPILDYGCTVWGFCSKKNSDFLERLQNKAMRIILRTNRLTCTQFMREKLGLLTLFNRWRYMRLQLVYRIGNDYNCPRQLQGYLVL